MTKKTIEQLDQGALDALYAELDSLATLKTLAEDYELSAAGVGDYLFSLATNPADTPAPQFPSSILTDWAQAAAAYAAAWAADRRIRGLPLVRDAIETAPEDFAGRGCLDLRIQLADAAAEEFEELQRTNAEFAEVTFAADTDFAEIATAYNFCNTRDLSYRVFYSNKAGWDVYADTMAGGHAHISVRDDDHKAALIALYFPNEFPSSFGA
jgi:hypothetical protein